MRENTYVLPEEQGQQNSVAISQQLSNQLGQFTTKSINTLLGDNAVASTVRLTTATVLGETASFLASQTGDEESNTFVGISTALTAFAALSLMMYSSNDVRESVESRQGAQDSNLVKYNNWSQILPPIIALGSVALGADSDQALKIAALITASTYTIAMKAAEKQDSRLEVEERGLNGLKEKLDEFCDRLEIGHYRDEADNPLSFIKALNQRVPGIANSGNIVEFIESTVKDTYKDNLRQALGLSLERQGVRPLSPRGGELVRQVANNQKILNQLGTIVTAQEERLDKEEEEEEKEEGGKEGEGKGEEKASQPPRQDQGNLVERLIKINKREEERYSELASELEKSEVKNRKLTKDNQEQESQIGSLSETKEALETSNKSLSEQNQSLSYQLLQMQQQLQALQEGKQEAQQPEQTHPASWVSRMTQRTVINSTDKEEKNDGR